jgi:hypothetical protein
MVGTTSDWKDELGRWLKPFLDRLGHKARRQMCPLYVAGLIGPGDRKSVQPMAERLAPSDYDQLHHFVAAGIWDAAPLETELLIQADRLNAQRRSIAVSASRSVSLQVSPQFGHGLSFRVSLSATANTASEQETPVPPKCANEIRVPPTPLMSDEFVSA